MDVFGDVRFGGQETCMPKLQALSGLIKGKQWLSQALNIYIYILYIYKALFPGGTLGG